MTRIFRLLLQLLPRRRRVRFGDEMAGVFDELRQRERREHGRLAAIRLDAQELGGVARFILREWTAALREALPGSSANLSTELLWVWRGLRSRGWSAPLVVLLLGGAIGATVTTFSVADALVFNPHPYPDADRIVRLAQFVEPERRPNRESSAKLHDEWRRHRDLFSAVGGYLQKGGVFLQNRDSSEQVGVTDITIELLDVLGITPAWGRPFNESDLTREDRYVALVGEAFARRRFGRPESALGRRLEATGRPLVIVGVMPKTFAFPSAATDLWRLMDPRGPLTTNFSGVELMARAVPGMALETLGALTQSRAAAVGAATALPALSATVEPYFMRSPRQAAAGRNADRLLRQAAAARNADRLLLLLLGAGLSLLLISCANVASLELAHAIRQTHASAVRAALGASRALLARLAALEGLLLASAGLVAGLGVAVLLIELAQPYLPASFTRAQNPIDLDTRAVTFSFVAAVVAWLLLSVPAMAHLARPGALTLGQRATPPGSARLRRRLTVVQVALAVSLVTVGLLYSRSYRELLALDKGFDSVGVAVVTVSMPSNYFETGAGREAVTGRLLAEVRRLPGVLAASRSSPPPNFSTPMITSLWVNGHQVAEEVRFADLWVDVDYFRVARLPLLAGRLLQPGDPPTHIVIPQSFARRFWPDGHAIGGTVRGRERSSFSETMTVVGVVADFRRDAVRMPNADDPLLSYRLRPPLPTAVSNRQVSPAFVDSGGSYAFLTISVRVATPEALPAVQAAVQAMDPRLAVTLDLVDDSYAQMNAPVLLAARAVGIFSLVSFAIAMAGLYGVIAFVVASRTREIGIRIALGADGADIRRMVLTTSGRMVLAGSAAGVAIAFGAARWVESQLFGVSPSDPSTYALVVGAVGLTSMVATWAPARQAARTDPAITLRAE
jgi:predicted permease